MLIWIIDNGNIKLKNLFIKKVSERADITESPNGLRLKFRIDPTL